MKYKLQPWIISPDETRDLIAKKSNYIISEAMLLEICSNMRSHLNCYSTKVLKIVVLITSIYNDI